MTRIALFVLLCCTALPSVVHATTGGPSTTELLGYDAHDAKIYYLIYPGGEVDDLPALHFVRLEGASIGKPVFVKSYYPDGMMYESDEMAEAFEQRIQRLRKRLIKLTLLAKSKRSEDQYYGTILPKRVKGVRIRRQVTKRWEDDNFVRCRDVSLELTRGKLKGAHSITECGAPARVSAIYQPPGRSEVLAMLSYKPDSDEGGYENLRPVLLR
jgi:hypothetical protein